MADGIRRFIALGALFLGGCAVQPLERLSQQPIEQVSLPAMQTPSAVSDSWPGEAWWSEFGDPQLDRLMRAALAGSPNLAAAQARLIQAQAAVGVALGNAAPQINADLNASRGRQSENYIIPKPPMGVGGEVISQGAANVNLGFDLDFWGRHQALINSAKAQANAAGFESAATRLALTSAIARAYAQLASQHELLDIVDATLKQRHAMTELTRQRLAAGLDTRLEVRQAESNGATLEAERVQLVTAISVSRLQLAALSGAMPEAALRIERPHLQGGAFSVPASLPLDLLSRRPEIAAQRARIASAREEVGAAQAQYYPNISLTALAGFQSIGLNQLFSAASLTNSIGPAIHLPIFDGGRIRANVDLRQQELEGAIAQYNQSVLAAAQDVAEQLTRAAALDREAAATATALAAAEDGYRIAMLRYGEGLTSFLNVLAVEGQLLTLRRTQADLDARRRDTRIQLIRALGGGFSAPLSAKTTLQGQS